MIDEWNDDRSGWARFSDDKLMRYRLARALVPGLGPLDRLLVTGKIIDGKLVKRLVRVVFVLMNPSTADAFKPDPTVGRCVKFARRWGADVLEVVNLFAFRSPYPNDVKFAEVRGDDRTNDIQILRACRGADKVIAGWGNHGELANRARAVHRMLDTERIKLWHLGLNDNGTPKHPMSRGKGYIPDDIEPAELEICPCF